MTAPMPGRSASGIVAIVVHAALVIGVAVTTGVLVVLRARVAGTLRADHPLVLLGVAFAVAGLAVVLVPILLRRIEPRPPEMDEGEWWARTLPKAIAVWAAGDVAGLTGAAFYLVTGQAAALLVTAVGLAILIFTSPGRLRER